MKKLIFSQLSNFKYNALKRASLPHCTYVPVSDKTNAYDLLCRTNPYTC